MMTNDAKGMGMFRFGVISPLLSESDEPLCSRFERIAAEVRALPNGSLRQFSPATIEDWYYDYKNYGAHFIEVVYAISSRSDIALGFGVDPWVLYRIRNQYMDIGWDQFVFSNGASQADAFADPEQLGARLEQAEGSLESERRLMLEARLRF